MRRQRICDRTPPGETCGQYTRRGPRVRGMRGHFLRQLEGMKRRLLNLLTALSLLMFVAVCVLWVRSY